MPKANLTQSMVMCLTAVAYTEGLSFNYAGFLPNEVKLEQTLTNVTWNKLSRRMQTYLKGTGSNLLVEGALFDVVIMTCKGNKGYFLVLPEEGVAYVYDEAMSEEYEKNPGEDTGDIWKRL